MSENKNYMERIQDMIDAYYENDKGMPQTVGSDTASDDVERLKNHLSSFPRYVNELVDMQLVKNISFHLPDEDREELIEKHEKKCAEALESVKKSIDSIQSYASATKTPHLFMKSELENESDKSILLLVVNVISDMYGEDHKSPEVMIKNLVENRLHLDTNLLELEDEVNV